MPASATLSARNSSKDFEDVVDREDSLQSRNNLFKNKRLFVSKVPHINNAYGAQKAVFKKLHKLKNLK